MGTFLLSQEALKDVTPLMMSVYPSFYLAREMTGAASLSSSSSSSSLLGGGAAGGGGGGGGDGVDSVEERGRGVGLGEIGGATSSIQKKQTGYLNIVKQLLDAGTDLTLQDLNKRTALHLAYLGVDTGHDNSKFKQHRNLCVGTWWSVAR